MGAVISCPKVVGGGWEHVPTPVGSFASRCGPLKTEAIPELQNKSPRFQGSKKKKEKNYISGICPTGRLLCTIQDQTAEQYWPIVHGEDLPYGPSLIQRFVNVLCVH